MDREVKAESPLSSPPSSPLSILSNSPPPPSPPPSQDASKRYPSPSSSSAPSGSASPMKQTEAAEICVRTDGPPPAKRRKVSQPKPRTTEYVDLERRTEDDEVQLDRLLLALRKKKKIVVIAGAGISVSAGIPDFRSSTGLFSTLRGQHKLKASGKHLFDAAVYKNDSDTSSFHTMVRELAHMTSEAKPTPFHLMLASVAEEGRLMRLYSQNIDCIDTQIPPLATNVPLNLKGPWPPTIQLHGGIEKMVCSKCGSLEPFNGSLFEGPEPPPCTTCREQDEVRTAFAGKRSHGIGKMRPRIVLYNEHNPDEEAIGNVSKADLRRVPDAVIVVGTSLKIPGVRRLVKEMCQLTRSRRDGFTAWINVDPEPQGAEFKDCWDLVVRGKCDDVAELAHLPRWDEQDIGVRNAYMVTGDELKEKRCKEALDRDRIDVLLEKKRRTPDSEATSAAVDDHSTEAKSKAFEHVQGGIITPRASPKPRHQLPAKALSKTKQSKLSFGPTSAKGVSTSEPKKITKAKRAAKPKKEKTKPKNGLNLTFKATKNVSGPEKQTVTPKKEPDSEPYSSDLSSPIDYPDDFGLPSLRPFVKAPEAIKYHIEFGQSPVEGDVCPRPSTPPPRERRDSTTATISPNSKPRSMGHLID